MGTHQLRELLALMEPLAERIDKVTLFRFDRTFGNDAERFFQRNERIEKRSKLAREIVGVDPGTAEHQSAAASDRDLAIKADGHDMTAAKLAQRFFLVVRFDQHVVWLFAFRRRQIFVKRHPQTSALQFRRGTVEFLRRRNSRRDLRRAVLLKRHHAVFHCNLLQFGT